MKKKSIDYLVEELSKLIQVLFVQKSLVRDEQLVWYKVWQLQKEENCSMDQNVGVIGHIYNLSFHQKLAISSKTNLKYLL